MNCVLLQHNFFMSRFVSESKSEPSEDKKTPKKTEIKDDKKEDDAISTDTSEESSDSEELSSDYADLLNTVPLHLKEKQPTQTTSEKHEDGQSIYEILAAEKQQNLAKSKEVASSINDQYLNEEGAPVNDADIYKSEAQLKYEEQLRKNV